MGHVLKGHGCYETEERCEDEQQCDEPRVRGVFEESDAQGAQPDEGQGKAWYFDYPEADKPHISSKPTAAPIGDEVADRGRDQKS